MEVPFRFQQKGSLCESLSRPVAYSVGQPGLPSRFFAPTTEKADQNIRGIAVADELADSGTCLGALASRGRPRLLSD